MTDKIDCEGSGSSAKTSTLHLITGSDQILLVVASSYCCNQILNQQKLLRQQTEQFRSWSHIILQAEIVSILRMHYVAISMLRSLLHDDTFRRGPSDFFQ